MIIINPIGNNIEKMLLHYENKVFHSTGIAY